MQINGIDKMCIANLDGDCSEQCQVGDMNTVFASTDAGALETSRFCLLDCLPDSDKIGGDCKELSEHMTKQLLTDDGNGDDPAMLMQPGTRAIPRPLPPEKLDLQLEPAQAMDAEA